MHDTGYDSEFPSPYGVVSLNHANIYVDEEPVISITFPSPYGVVSLNPVKT